MSNSNRRLAGFSLELTELKLTGESTNISLVIVGVFTVSWIGISSIKKIVVI